jgi:hypothetical protein
MKPVAEDNIFRRQLTTQRMWPILRLSSLLRASQNEFFHTFLTPFPEALQHAQEKIHYQMDRLRGKVSRAGLARSELFQRHAQSLTRFLMPRKDLQERQVGRAYFLGRAGYELLPRLLSEIQTDSPGYQVVSL